MVLPSSRAEGVPLCRRIARVVRMSLSHAARIFICGEPLPDPVIEPARSRLAHCLQCAGRTQRAEARAIADARGG